jgi:hypothetical protein
MERLVIGMPLYGSVSVTFFDRWNAIDKRPVVSITTVKGTYLAVSMEVLVQQVLEQPGWDRLVVYEQDMMPPADALVRIAQMHHEYDIVGTMYFGHRPPHVAQVCEFHDEDGYQPIGPEMVDRLTRDPGLHPAETVAMGLTSIGRRCLERWHPEIPMWQGDPSVPQGTSHDVFFCHQARRQGFTVAVDSGLICGHLTLIEVGLEHNQDHAKVLR